MDKIIVHIKDKPVEIELKKLKGRDYKETIKAAQNLGTKDFNALDFMNSEHDRLKRLTGLKEEDLDEMDIEDLHKIKKIIRDKLIGNQELEKN